MHFYETMDAEERDVKLGPVDLNMLEYAANMMCDEFSVVYNQSRDSIKEYLDKRVEKL